MRNNMRRGAVLYVLLIFSAVSFGCATFRIPAPHAPVTPVQEAVVESSTITVPITVSISSLTKKLDQLLSRSKRLKKLDRENNIAGKIQGLLNGQADPDVLNNIYVRLAIRKAWDALQSPIRLNYNLSLLLNPQAVHISPATRRGDSATFLVGLIAKPKLVSGDLPKTPPQSPPNFSLAQGRPETGFHIALDNELSFDFIGKELTKKLKDKTYTINNKNIVLDTIKVYGSGETIIVEAKVKGTASGTVYLIGMPAYDESTMTVYVKNLDYTLETKNILAKAADWLLHSELRDNLAEQATWFIGDKIDAVKDRLTDALNRKVNHYVSMSGKIQRVRPVAVGITTTSIKAVLIADGTVEVRVF